MNIKSLHIENFRLLKNINITLDGTTIIVGKNNCGKTSLIEILNIFLNSENKLSTDDFNLKYLKECYKSKNIPIIKLSIILNYNDLDNWTHITPFITTLENNNQIKLEFIFKPDNDEKFIEYITSNTNLSFDKFKTLINDSYKIFRYTCNFDEEYPYKLEVSNDNIKKLLKFYSIEAQRSIDDSNSNNSNKFSQILNTHYENMKKKCDGDPKIESILQKIDTELKKKSDELDNTLLDFFNIFKTSFKKFGFTEFNNENEIILKSNLNTNILFKNIMKVYYSLFDDNILPEKYNGLGYSNLLYIITKILSFQLLNKEENSSTYLVSIEEPEAHMHPQMQKIFIQKIQDFLKEEQFTCQILLTTHSTEIVSNSNFKFIRYFLKNKNKAEIKDLNKFKPKNTNEFIFLKKYIFSGKTEMFFADKLILVEGTTERILIPKFLEKISPNNSEYISIIEIGGAYMNIFKEFLEFLRIPTLIITDIDSVDNKGKGCEIEKNKTLDGSLKTSNPTLKNWIPKESAIKDLLNKTLNDKSKDDILVVYQKNYETLPQIKCGRSFEEDFIIKNYSYIFKNKNNLKTLSSYRAIQNMKESTIKSNSYKIYQYIAKNNYKSNFAFELLLNDSWDIPDYIKEGLEWLLKK